MTDIDQERIRVKRFTLAMKGASPSIMAHVFTNGGCYRFYMLLKAAFPKAQAYYNTENDHIVTKIAGIYWDIYGAVNNIDVGKKLTAGQHETASLFQFDEINFVTRRIREYMDGEE